MGRALTNGREELLRWVLVLGVLALIFLGPLGHWRQQARAKRALAHATTRQLATAVKDFQKEYGSLPSGDLKAIVAALDGNNPRRLAFFSAPTRLFDANGELIDPWGAPYRFDIRAGAEPRFWSRGKDGRDQGGDKGSDDIPNWR
jgi:type II secretory pathway pseudopilin PulG